MRKDKSFSRGIYTLGRVIQYGVKNLLRNAWLSIAAIAVMFVALVIILATVVLNVTANNAIAELSKNLKVSVYLKDDVTDEQRSDLESEISNNQYVEGLEFVSKDDAQNRFVSSFGNDQELLQGLSLIGADTLPSSYEVSVSDLSRLPEIETIANKEQYAEVVDSVTLGRTDARRTIDRAASAQQFITTASIFAAGTFTVISVLIIFNTIRIAIFTRSEEIRNMKLVGATPSFIRGPFIVETSIYGVIAGLSAASASYSIIISLGSKIATQAEFAKTYTFFTEPTTVALVYIGSVTVGIVVGIFSSMLAMQKYLKLKHW